MTRNADGAGVFLCANQNERCVQIVLESNWRASLVPAAAVIPAPGAYFKIVAVKKLVVGFVLGSGGVRMGDFLYSLLLRYQLSGWGGMSRFSYPCHTKPTPPYFEKKKVFQAGSTPLNTLAWNNPTRLRILWLVFDSSHDR